MTGCSPWRSNRGATMRRRRLACWNIGPFIIPLFPLPHRLHRPNLCRGPGIAPCLWWNPWRPTTLWWRTHRPLSTFFLGNVEQCPCHVVESLEATEGWSGATSLVLMSGTKGPPSLVDDSQAVPKVHNLCWGGRESGGGRFSNPPKKFGLSSLNYAFYGGPPMAGTAPLGAGSRGCNGLGACFCFPSVDPITYCGS